MPRTCHAQVVRKGALAHGAHVERAGGCFVGDYKGFRDGGVCFYSILLSRNSSEHFLV